MATIDRVAAVSSRARMRLISDERLVAAIRKGERAAFEALYDRHSRELLAFSVYMLGSRQDGEDAVQATYASAYRALRADTRPVRLRPWLFTIARNECISVLRRRRETVELNGEVATTGDPVRLAEIGETMRDTIASILELPEEQRAALVLAEVHGLSHSDVATVLGSRPEQVKAYIYQARSHLLAEREAREADCHEIRQELSNARGAALLRGRLRRHLRTCEGCRDYADSLAGHRQRLGALLPLLAPAALRYRALEDALGLGGADPATYAGGAAVGATVAGAAAEVAGGGIKALAVKVATGVAALGASAGVGVSVLSVSPPAEHNLPAAHTSESASARSAAPSGSRLTISTLSASRDPSGVEESSGQIGGSGRGPANRDIGTGTLSSESQTPAGPPGSANPPAAGTRTAPGGSGSARQEHAPRTVAQEAQEAREDQAAREARQLKQTEREALQRRQATERAEREAQAPHSAEERRQRHREKHEEAHPIGVSRAPKSEEERERDRAEHSRRHEEKLRKRQEEREREERGES